MHHYIYLIEYIVYRNSSFLGSSIFEFLYLDFKLLYHHLLFNKLQTRMSKGESISLQMLITGYNNSVMSCNDISLDLVFFFTQFVIAHISFAFSFII